MTLSLCVWSHVTHWDDALSICMVARSHLSSPNWSWDEPPKVMGLPRLNGVSDALGGEPQMLRLEAASWPVVLKSRVPAWLHCLPISAMGLRMYNKINHSYCNWPLPGVILRHASSCHHCGVNPWPQLSLE